MIDETIQKFTGRLSYRYRCPKETAYDAVVEAYTEIESTNKTPENIKAYWYQASKYKLFNKFDKQRRRPDQQVFEEWMVGEEDEEIVLHPRTEVFEELEKKLTARQWKFLNQLREGVPLVAICEQMGFSYNNIVKEKRTLIFRCKEILNLI